MHRPKKPSQAGQPTSRRWSCASRVLFLGTLAAISAPALPAAIPAFPGAEGFAACSTGGRGGDVYTVRNLDEDGPGSFAEGIRSAPPQGRTIVFAVGGRIPIRRLTVKASNITIAGQTAPGDGVVFQGSIFWISGSNVVVRFVGFREGNDKTGGDCLETDGGAANLLVDHCDVMFSTDENFSMFRSAPPTMTFQWSINAWGMQHHSCGGLWMVDHTTAHHTLWANNHTRNPKVIRPKAFDWVNNVTFGWDIGMNLAGADVPGDYRVNLRGSTFIHGFRSGNAVFGGGALPDGSLPYAVHISDCALDGNRNRTFDVTAEDYGIMHGNQYRKQKTPFPQTAAFDPKRPRDEVLGVPVTVDPRHTAYKKVLSQAGPVRLDVNPDKPLRDEAGTLLIRDILEQRRRIISDPKELGLSDGGFGRLGSGPAPVDSDADGMPDGWEKTLGSDPRKMDHNDRLPSADGSTFFPKNSPAEFTRLEEYLHFLAIPHGVVVKNQSLRIDLAKFTKGFANLPTYRISAQRGGSVKQTGTRDSVVLFRPAYGHTGRASFDFQVTDADGDTWTQTCAILVWEP